MELILSLCIGVGLSAACGFRIFVPMLVMSIAANAGHLNLAPSFDWIGTPAALGAFSLATCLEIAGFYIPWVDHFLDTVATPAAIVAGTIVTASMVSDVSPFMKWSLALVAGGGAAGLVQGATVLARGASFATTGGIGNPLVATAELGGSLITSLFAIFVPVFAIVMVVGLVGFVGMKAVRKARPVAL
ncbi:MAG: DUF4126 domain-containing protein [Verrucomicrobiales bacterium]